MALQQRFASFNPEHPEQPIRVRIGLHSGEALREGNRLFGKTPIVTSRIASQARGDEILVSSSVKELSAKKPETFSGMREVALKGLSGTHRLYEVTWS